MPMPKKGRGNKSRPTAAAAAGNHSDPSRSMTDDLGAPEILTPTPCPDPPPDDQQPLDTAAVTVIGSPVFPDVASSSAFPDVVGSPAIPVAAASSGVSVVSDDVPAPPTTSRKGPGKRKKPLAVKKLAAIQEKLDFLSQNLRPVPFAPGRAPDLGRHERLFRILGLWDFAHLNLAADPLRPDLLSDLIAHYTPPSRSSTVCELRINVSRADLARALSLPVKKTTPVEDELTLFKTEEASAVLTGFIQDWILVLEDTCVVPPEVVLATDTVREGHAFKVDWAGLVWTMVEKELQEATKSGQCLYASHLQRLIKHQRPELFKEEAGMGSEPEVLVEVTPAVEEDKGGYVAPAEEEDGTVAAPPAEQDVEMQNATKTTTLDDFPDMDVDAAEQEVEVQNADKTTTLEDFPDMDVDAAEQEVEVQNATKTTTLEDFPDMDVDANGPQLSLGLGSEVDRMLGLEEKCDAGVEPHRLTGGKDGGNNSHYMQHCSLNDLTALDCDTYLREEEDNGGEEEDNGGGADGRQFETKFNGLEQLNSTDLLQAVTDGNVSYSIPQHSVGQSSSDFLATGTGTHKNIASGSGPASPFSFGKRDINEMDDGDEVHQFSQINPQKRIRSEGQWGGNHGTTSSFTADFEQTQLWANKIKMNYSETERALANTQMQLQYVNDMLQQKDQMIHSLEKARMEEAQKRELEACRFEHELRLLSQKRELEACRFEHDLRLLSQKRELEACRFERELEACRFEHDLRLLSQKRELEACRFEHELRLLSQKRELEACLFEHELRLLSRVVSGRKSALVETRNVFAEYRNKFSQGKEPLYKDVEGGGGLVLSAGEIERLEQLKKEEVKVKSFEEEKERRVVQKK